MTRLPLSLLSESFAPTLITKSGTLGILALGLGVGLVGVGLAVPRPRISAVRGYPFEIPLPAELPERGVVLAALPRLSALARL